MTTNTPTTQVSRRPAPTVPRGNPLAELCFNWRVRRRAIWLLGLLTLLFVLIVGAFNAYDARLPYDERLTLAMQGSGEGTLGALYEVVGFVGYSPWNAIVGAALCIALALWMGWQVGALLVGMTAVQGLIGVLIKFPITIQRPMETELHAPLDIIRASSFPSGHTSMYVVLFGFPVYLLWRHCAPRWLTWLATIVYLLMVLLIGPARVSLGAHWWSDIIGAHLLGFFILFLGIEIYEQRLLPRLSLAERWDVPLDSD